MLLMALSLTQGEFGGSRWGMGAWVEEGRSGLSPCWAELEELGKKGA